MNLNGDPVPGSHWLLPSAAPVVRAGLCSLAQPSLRQARHTPRFLFHEACLLLVAAGRLDLHDGSHQTTVDTPSCLLLVQAHTSADLMKTPGSGGQPFRSVLLALSPELLEAFHRTRAQPAALPQDEQAFRQLPLDDDLQDALRQVLASVPSPTISDERLRYRLMDLLAALAERGHILRRAGPPGTASRLRTLIAQAPQQHWTAHSAGSALAMSEATLRRRLAGEGVRFEELLVDTRMHHAMLLVQTTGWSLQHIAQACGYQSRARFSERFRARFGYSPSALR
ncbi:AraC family transcriptional regulator [Delftia tsuruhatensis]|uniref:AraC family transcriptional regulator n=1 Tax=Delftia tsuruhatensis TaxID=180282 RepID=UPI00370B1CAC